MRDVDRGHDSLDEHADGEDDGNGGRDEVRDVSDGEICRV